MTQRDNPVFFIQTPEMIAECEQLTEFEQKLFGVIYTMLNTNATFFLKNQTIANRYHKSIKTISNSITKLKELGLISVHYEYKEGTEQIIRRDIKLTSHAWKFISGEYGNELPEGMEEKVKDNRLSNNRLSNNNATTTENEKLNDEFEVQNVLTLYQNNIGVLNPITIQDINYWCKDLSPAVVKEAIIRTAQANKTWRYTVGILHDWVKHNIKTIDQVEANDVKFKKKNEAKYSNRSNQTKGARYQAGDKGYEEMRKREEQGLPPI